MRWWAADGGRLDPEPDAQPFDLKGSLPTGVTVLEASAGTGKTYTIAALAARFIAEGAASLDQLLLVTFTRAATSELRERVRERLVQTEAQLTRVAAGALPTHMDEVIDKLAGASIEVVRERQQRLAHAIANFDAATIETTHGFCQKVLDGLGTLAESDPSVSFADNVDDLAREVIDDLYVRRFYRDHDGLSMSRQQAEQVARIAIDNPLAPIYPLEPRSGSAEAMRCRLAVAIRAELDSRKRALGLMTHDDQLTRLLDTLKGPRGADAVAMLKDDYRVVLIDEFQDTDPIQWEIVERAFGHGETTLVLIGDPKQAIYAFRGADVYAYLAAADSAGARATLGVNRRSDQPLLDGLDALFGHARLGHPGIVYRSVEAAPVHRTPRLLGAPSEGALRVRLLEVSEPSVVRTPSGFPNAESARAFVARDLAADVVSLLNSGATIETRDDEGKAVGTHPVAPGCVAVLVRTHRNAWLIQSALEELGVPAVISGSGSVFATPAAADWLALLEALEQPSHPARARTAALTSLLGWSATELAGATESQLEVLHQRLHGWARTLREHGVSTLAESILDGERTAARLLTLVGGERRLTDLEHVAQLLGAAAGAEQFGVAALTGWLRQRIDAADREGSNDERTRRLDSDADAVQVLTFHRSKGLEFPVVYCPFLWDAGRLADEGQPVYFHDEQARRAIDVGLAGDRVQRPCAPAQRRGARRGAAPCLRRAHARPPPGRDLVGERLVCARLTARPAAVRPGRRGQRRLAGRPPPPRGRCARPLRADRSAGAPRRLGRAGRARHARALESGPGRRRAVGARAFRAAHRHRLAAHLLQRAHGSCARRDRRLRAREQAGVTDEPAIAIAPTPSELPLSQMASGPQLGTLIHEALQQLDFSAGDLTGELRGVATGRRRPPPGAARLPPGDGRRGAFTCARHPAWWRAWWALRSPVWPAPIGWTSWGSNCRWRAAMTRSGRLVWPMWQGCSTRCCPLTIPLRATPSGCGTRFWPRPCAVT